MRRNLRQLLCLFWLRSKRLLEFAFFWVFDSFVLTDCLRVEREERTAFVFIKLLGDYAIWLPFARPLVENEQSKGRTVVLVVNVAIEPLVKVHFPDVDCVGVDVGRFLRDWHYRRTMLKFLRSLGVSCAIHDFAPRDGSCSDAVIRALGAQESLGFDLTNPTRSWVDRVVSRRFYSRLLSVSASVHRSSQHRVMARALGLSDEKIHPIEDLGLEFSSPFQGDYLLVLPGASVARRRWPAKRFAAVAKRLMACSPGCTCIVAGTASEREVCEAVAQQVGSLACSWAGKTSLQDLLGLIINARLVLGNDSAAGHIAAAYGVPSLVVVGGGHYESCFPYPQDSPVHKMPQVFAHEMPCFGCDWLCRWSTAPGDAYPCLMAVSEADVLNQLSGLEKPSLMNPNGIDSGVENHGH